MNQKAIDYRRLGEVSGKAWRLGHLSADHMYMYAAINQAVQQFKVPKTGKPSFRAGFRAGIRAVDNERGKAKK